MNINITCYKELGEITIWDKKFNSVGNKYTNKVISTKHVSAETLKSLENSGNIKLLSTGLFDGYTDCSDASIINDLEVITIPSGGTANIKYYNGKFIDSGNLLAISSNKKLYNLKYIYYYLQKHINLIENAFRGASIKHPQMEDILAIKIPIYDIESQNKIVSILSELDNKIEKENQFIGKLKKIKQSFLELLFPNNNNNPKLRFENFTDTWEQRKLGEIYKFKYGEFNNNPSNGGEFPVFGANGIIGGYTKYNSEDAVIIGHMGEYAGSVLWGKGKHFVTYNGTISKPKVNFINSKFGYYVLYQKNINKICAGSGLPFLSYGQLNQIEIYYPNNIIEQIKISNFFTNIDSLITLHQCKCEKLKDVKKALLDKLLV